MHIVIALMRELTEYEDYIECALDEADYLAEHTAERMTHEEVFGEYGGIIKHEKESQNQR